MDDALPPLTDLRRCIGECLTIADAHRLIDVGIGLDKAYAALDGVIVTCGGVSVPVAAPALAE